MRNMTDELKKLLDDAVRAVASEKGYEIPEGFLVRIERPRQEGHGDWATNIAMQLAKPFGEKPRDLAAAIIAKIPENGVIEKAEVAGPGFMNFTLKSDWVAETIKTAIEKDADYGRSDAGKGRRVQVEFVSANPTGPLHMGHGRGAAVGDITASLLDFAGWDVEREYYTNDAGLQMELLGKSAQARYFQALGRADEAPMPEDGYQGDYMNDIAKVYVEKYGDTLAQKPLEETLEFFSQETGKMVLGMIRKDLEDFGVKFDVWFSEKSLYDNGAVEPAMEALKERGYAYEEEGALWFWFRSTLFGDDKDRVLIRSTGLPTYFTSDVASRKNKYDRGFERLVYVWGADHHGYVPRIKSVNKAFGFPDDGIEVGQQGLRLPRRRNRSAADTDGQPPARRQARPDVETRRHDSHAARDNGRSRTRRGEALLRNPPLRQHRGLRPRTCEKSLVGEPRLLHPVRAREDMQHPARARQPRREDAEARRARRLAHRGPVGAQPGEGHFALPRRSGESLR